VQHPTRARQPWRITSCGTKTYASSASPWAASTSSQGLIARASGHGLPTEIGC
jgi:hypothetical protein